MTYNNLLYMDQEEILDEYYKRILLIDNDMYTSNNIEEDRTKFINLVIDILEEYPDLCTSNSGDSFLRTILYPIIRMN
jgi:hypothetical protein